VPVIVPPARGKNPDIVAQVAKVPELAVRTCPEVGAVAALTDTVVVALFKPYPIGNSHAATVPDDATSA